MAESIFHDQKVTDMNNGSLQVKLLRGNQLTLAKAEEMDKDSEAAVLHNEAWAGKKEQVHSVKMKSLTKELQKRTKCFKCGREHKPCNCPHTARNVGHASQKIRKVKYDEDRYSGIVR